MFAEDSESDQEKWVRSIANRGFHCDRGVKLETFFIFSSHQGDYPGTEYALRAH